MNSGGGYAFHAAWSSANIEQQQQLQAQVAAAVNGCSSNLSAPCTSPSCNAKNIGPGAAGLLPVAAAAKASWTVVPDLLYDHSSLLDCTRCVNQGHLSRYVGEGHGQETISILDRELMLQDMQLNVEDDDDMGMEMKIMKKRKLTIEQARQLEASFEADKKLEAEKKQRLADQLGLQPRQVAVWFQNRRARSKTKQLEIDFLTLKTEYDRVLTQRRKLQAEVARLTSQLQEKCSKTQNNTCSQDSTSSTNSNNGDVVSGSTIVQTKKTSNDQDPTRDGEVLTSCNFGQDFGNSKEGITKPQELSKPPNLNAYDWEPYENGLWVFD